MIKLFGRLLAFAGEQRRSLILSFVFTVFNAMFETLPLMAILVVLIEVLDGLAGTGELFGNGVDGAHGFWRSECRK